ncbi:MAG: hypothetical protein ACK4GU_12240 [Alishewanella aestuarii]
MINQRTGLFLIAVLLLLKLVVQPWLSWSSDKAATIEQLKFNVQRLEVIDQRAASLGQLAEQIDRDFAILVEQLQAGDENSASVALARYLDQLAQKHNLELQNRNTGPVQRGDVTTMALNFFVRGNPADIIRFLTELEQGKPRIQLVNGSFSKPNVRATQLNANLSLLVLMQPEVSRGI